MHLSILFSFLFLSSFSHTSKLYDKTLTVLYAGRMTATQFEAKCQGKEGTVENKPLLPTTAINNKQGGQFPLNNQTTFRPPLAGVYVF